MLKKKERSKENSRNGNIYIESGRERERKVLGTRAGELK